MASHRILVVLGSNGQVSGDLGTAEIVVIALAGALEVTAWQPHRAPWGDDAHARERQEARIVEFVRDEGLEAIVTGSVAPMLRRALEDVGVPVFECAGVSARAAAASAAAVLDGGVDVQDTEAEIRDEWSE